MAGTGTYKRIDIDVVRVDATARTARTHKKRSDVSGAPAPKATYRQIPVQGRVEAAPSSRASKHRADVDYLKTRVNQLRTR